MHTIQEKKIVMSNLSERERTIPNIQGRGFSDYKIARKINIYPPSVTRSRKNAQKKLADAKKDLAWVETVGIAIPE